MAGPESSPTKVKVALLDDHQSTLDGYTFRLQGYPNIEVVASARFGDQILPLLKKHKVDVLVLDVSMPTSEEDPNPYPLLHMLPQLRAEFPDTVILVISMSRLRQRVSQPGHPAPEPHP